MADVPELDMTDLALLRDPSAAYVRAAGDSPVARLTGPGFAFWVVLRHAEGRAVLADPRLRTDEASYQRPDVPADCLPYMTTMSELNGAEHARLRRLV
ncbi:cytochrome P450, partial [Nonomuraea wenchangensis]